MSKGQEYTVSPPFTDPKNITVGKARVIYVKSYNGKSDGWALLGGARTTSFDVARAHAVAINVLMTEIGA